MATGNMFAKGFPKIMLLLMVSHLQLSPSYSFIDLLKLTADGDFSILAQEGSSHVSKVFLLPDSNSSRFCRPTS